MSDWCVDDEQPYRFDRVRTGDLSLINGWLQRPHVATWWDPATPYAPDDLEDPRVAMWLVHRAGRPFAFLQDYAVHGWSEHHLAYLPAGARGIDQFIAEPELLGLGHGPAFIRAHLAHLFAQGVPAVGTDPHPANRWAIAAYTKVGFQEVSAPVETAWGLCLLMECRPPRRD